MAQAHGGTAGSVFRDNTDGCGNGAAGSTYFKKEDYLNIDNSGIHTNKYTVVETKLRKDFAHSEDEYLIANIIIIEHNARVWVKGHEPHQAHILFPYFHLKDTSQMVIYF